MSKSPQPSEVRTWAVNRLSELNQERAALLQLFPGLERGATVTVPRPARGPAAPVRRRGNMSAAARRAVSKRMKRYWAERRKQKGSGGKKAASKD